MPKSSRLKAAVEAWRYPDGATLRRKMEGIRATQVQNLNEIIEWGKSHPDDAVGVHNKLIQTRTQLIRDMTSTANRLAVSHALRVTGISEPSKVRGIHRIFDAGFGKLVEKVEGRDIGDAHVDYLMVGLYPIAGNQTNRLLFLHKKKVGKILSIFKRNLGPLKKQIESSIINLRQDAGLVPKSRT